MNIFAILTLIFYFFSPAAWIAVINYGLTIDVAEFNTSIFEQKSEIQCKRSSTQCVIQFPNGYQEKGFDKPPFCLNASVTELPDREEYDIPGCKSYVHLR